MNLPLLTKSEIGQMFGCSIEQVSDQYAQNAKQLRKMYDKAIETGKKVNGYTAGQLEEMYKRYEQLSN